MGEQLTKVSKGGFLFCRIGVMLIVWIGYFLGNKELILLSFIILLLSAISTVKFAPMIMFHDYTIGLFYKGKKEVLNVKAMRFAHTLGTIFAGICVILLYFGPERIGWIVVLFFAIVKTISAVGFCPASKLYTCITKKGGCCALTSKKC